MLKKLMSLAVIGMLMVGCTDTKESVKHEVPDTSNSTRQEQQVQPKEKEVKKEQQIKEQPKEEVKKDTTKKEQNDNIDPETGLAKVKHGKHLQEEADKQDKQNEDDSVWTKDYCPECKQPIDDCICNGDGNTTDEWGNTLCPNCGWPKDNCVCGKDVEKPETMEYEIHKGTDADGNEYTDYSINGGYVDEDEFNNQMENFGK